MDKKTAEVRDTVRMREGVQRASSSLLDMTGVKNGKITKPGPLPLDCDGYEPEGQVIHLRHSWSIYDLPFEELEKAYAALRRALPEKGWKIVSDGPDTSRAKTPTIVADSPDGDFSADLRLMDNRDDKDPTSVLSITVVSRCFQES
ncbi:MULTISPECIES: hypothetical protein [Streptomyces]|uniref:hypothetical protein n=1 Tax=Streptomyces TaxID=1883 RepID=UPI001316C64D|nr:MULTISPECIES: hypothetical protein [Streptomyces]QGZ49457.1 hypothetical protein GPZ77_14705 [Streptomyces sp. QHH-9511]GGU09345.1 hypothetical protein GCM10010272_63100 [Streptomyces lateritius]